MTALEWMTENYRMFIWAGVVVFFVGGLLFLTVGIRDRWANRDPDTDSQRILAGFGLAEEPVIAASPMLSEVGWRGWVTRTQPRYAEVPAILDRRQYLGRHADGDELLGEAQDPSPIVVEEHEEGYIGRHRLPEAATASYIQALMTQTQEFRPLRTLSPVWRSA